MLKSLFPERIDNVRRGHVLSLWLLVPLAIVKVLQGASVAGLLGAGTTRYVLETADRVPVGTFPPGAASHIVFLFAAWGLGIFILGLLGIVAVVRYRAMIPLAYLFLLIEQVGRKTLATVHLGTPFLSVSATSASLINWGFLLVILTGFVLSLWPKPATTFPAPRG